MCYCTKCCLLFPPCSIYTSMQQGTINLTLVFPILVAFIGIILSFTFSLWCFIGVVICISAMYVSVATRHHYT